MKKLPFILLSVFVSTTISAQSIYYDAIAIEELRLDPSSNTFGPATALILEEYYSTSLSNNDLINAINDSIKTNPFMENYSIPTGPMFLGSRGNSIAKSIGGIDVTTVADGLAKFLVDRTKQELSVAFFEKFKTEVNNSDELKILFPQTKKVLDAIGEEIYMYTNYINSLKEAFNKDMDNILTTLEIYIDEKVDDENVSEPVGDAMYLTNLIKNGEHPGEAISMLSGRTDSYNSSDYKVFRESLAVLNAFSQSLRFRADSLYWVPSDSLSLIFEKNTFNTYLGLVYQKHKNLPLADSTFGQFLEALKVNVDTLKVPIRAISKSAESLQIAMKSLKNKKEAKDKIESFYELFNGTTNLISKFDQLIDLNVSSTEEVGKFKKYVYVASLINDILLDINEKKYNSILIDLFALGDTLNITNDENKNAFGGKFLKYGSFMANVVQAENSSEVQAAIEAAALPVGSASIKKKTEFNIALNSYVGIAGGGEKLLSTPNGSTGFERQFGITAPTGINFSWGGQESESSFSIFLSIIDVGALVSYRFSDTGTVRVEDEDNPGAMVDAELEVEELPEIQLKNIIAPGGYLVYGIPKWPVSVGAGMQWGPQLRKINVTPEGELNPTLQLESSSIRWQVFFAVDIPLINFYTKSR